MTVYHEKKNTQNQHLDTATQNQTSKFHTYTQTYTTKHGASSYVFDEGGRSIKREIGQIM